MNKFKTLLKGSPLAMIVAGLLVAGVASAALLTIYGHTQGRAEVKQSVLFGDGTNATSYQVGNSAPVAGNVYYELETLVNHASDKPAGVQINTSYQSSAHSSWWTSEPGITTSYMHWTTPQNILTGVRPTVVYNSTGSKKYEMWYKTSEAATKIRYAYYSGGTWHGTDTSVSGSYDAPFVTKEGEEYYMVNYGPSGEKQFDIYTSTDGINWTDKGAIYAYSGSWYKIDNPEILKDDGGYKMYFQMKKTNDSTTQYYIFLATSSAKSMKQIAYDAGQGIKDFSIVSGDKYAGSILAPGAEGDWDSFRVMQPMVFKSGDKGYLMLYTGYDKYDVNADKIGYAKSADGIHNWTKVKVSKEGYDSTLGIGVFQPSIVKTNNNITLVYQKGNKINWTWLTHVLDGSNQMTLQPQEIKPFFIQNDFAINLTPYTYNIKTSVIPVTD